MDGRLPTYKKGYLVADSEALYRMDQKYEVYTVAGSFSWQFLQELFGSTIHTTEGSPVMKSWTEAV